LSEGLPKFGVDWGIVGIVGRVGTNPKLDPVSLSDCADDAGGGGGVNPKEFSSSFWIFDKVGGGGGGMNPKPDPDSFSVLDELNSD